MDRLPESRTMEMQEIQKVSFEILKFVANTCETLGLRYVLFYGTLLGAVRHGGYIPWDDDVDIMMPRPDYDKLIEYFTNNPDTGYYKLYNRAVNKKYIYGISRICDTRYHVIKDDEVDCGMGIFIDIYPYDGLGNDRAKALSILGKTRKFCDIIVSLSRKEKKIPDSLNWKGRMLYIVYRFLRELKGIDYYLKRLNKLHENISYDESGYVGPSMWYFSKPESVLFRKSDFTEVMKLNFENEEFNVPKKYKQVLMTLYGDFMQLPPEDQRIYHHAYKAYRQS